MLGAIIGDIVGSIYEFDNIKTKDFPFFSDECEFTGNGSAMRISPVGWAFATEEETLTTAKQMPYAMPSVSAVTAIPLAA